MGSLDKVMDRVKWFFLEVLSGIQLLIKNVNLYNSYKTDIWM